MRLEPVSGYALNGENICKALKEPNGFENV